MYRIIGADGKEYGPISADQLRQWIAEGRAGATSHVFTEGSTEWKTLGSLPEFSLLFASRIQPASPAAYQTGSTTSKGTAFATTGLVLGIVSLTVGLCCCYGLPFNILGAIFSAIALVQIKNDPARYGGKGMAIAGLVLSLISILIAIGIFIVFCFISFFDHATHHAYKL